jgi:ATP/maltotriose-dependent transcriptional regulator MalT
LTLVRDIQHLLRHLGDPSQLRQNPIAGALFESGVSDGALVAQLRAMIASAVDELAKEDDASDLRVRRMATIIRRCDLDGEYQDAVAREIGLQKRQFFRERRLAIERIAPQIYKLVEARSLSIQAPPNENELLVEAAVWFRYRGFERQALQHLLAVVKECSDPVTRISALIELVDFHCMAGRIEACEELLGEIQAVRSQWPDDPFIEMNARLARAIVAHTRSGGSDPAITLLQSIACEEPIRHLTASCPSLRAHLLMSKIELERGNAAAASRGLSEIDDIFESSTQAAPDRYATYLLLRQELASLRGNLEDAVAAATACFEHSRANGLPLFTAQSAIAMASSYSHRGDYGQARSWASDAYMLGQSFNDDSLARDARMICASIELRAGFPAQALSIFEDCRAAYPGDGSPHGVFDDALFAKILVESGKVVQALAIIEQVGQALERAGYLRFQGYVDSVRAEVYYAAGERKRAAEAIDYSLSLLQCHGHPHSLARAYQISAMITKNPSHERRAREIISQLSS